MAREYPLERYRNIGIMAHIDAGKTTTTERILFYTGAIHKMGEVARGQHHHGLDGAGARARHHHHLGRDHRLWNATASATGSTSSTRPGHVDFTIEVERSPARARRRGGGVRRRATASSRSRETVWRQADKYKVPRICFINKMDRIGADFDHVGRDHPRAPRRASRADPAPHRRRGSSRAWSTWSQMKAHRLRRARARGAKFEPEEIPAELQDAGRRSAAQQLSRRWPRSTTQLMEKFLDGQGAITEDELRAALRKGTIAHEARSRCSAARRSRTRACSRCWTRWWTSCPAAGHPAGHGKDPERRGSRARSPTTAPFSRAGVQGHDRPLVGS